MSQRSRGTGPRATGQGTIAGDRLCDQASTNYRTLDAPLDGTGNDGGGQAHLVNRGNRGNPARKTE